MLLLLAIAGVIFFASFTTASQAILLVTLHNENFSFTSQGFYIAGISDDRDNRASVASLIVVNTAHPSITQTADLQGGAATAIKLFIDHNLHQDLKLRPVVIGIKEFRLIESNLPSGHIAGNLSVTFSFSLQQGDGLVHLIDYTGGLKYDRDIRQTDVAEPALRHSIESAMLYFNTWMDKQADSNPLFAKAVQVKFTDYTEKTEGDTIYYSTTRPLTWDDFRDKPRNERFDAEIYSSIGYAEQTEIIKGIIHVNISLKVDAPKSDCWVKAGSRTDYTLNHEQRHFDIEKLVSEHFKQKILAMNLTVDNYDGPINVEYLETLREATRLQKQYDAETRHGSDQQAQTEWNEKIDKELRACGVKK